MLSVGAADSQKVEDPYENPLSALGITRSKRPAHQPVIVGEWLTRGAELPSRPAVEVPHEPAARHCAEKGYAPPPSSPPGGDRQVGNSDPQQVAYDAAAAQRAHDIEVMRHAGALARGLATLDQLAGFQDGLIGLPELNRAANDPNFSPELREAARYFLSHPDELDKLDTAAGIGGKDHIFGLPDFEARIQQLNQQIQRPLPERPARAEPSDGRPAPSSGESVPPERVPSPWIGGVSEVGEQDPALRDYRSALRVLLGSFATVDAAGGRSDGAVTRADLEAIYDNPNASERLKKAVEFLLDHPEYLRRLDGASGPEQDGRIRKADVEGELRDVDRSMQQVGQDERVGRAYRAFEGMRVLCEPAEQQLPAWPQWWGER